MQIITLKIHSYNQIGEGIGEFLLPNGETREVVVAYTSPGDEVSAQVIRKRRKKWEGKLLQILSSGPSRVSPKCPHFTICGGCLTQQIPYSEQLAIKESKVKSLFSITSSITGCEKIWGYRGKMEFSFSQDKKGERYLGLYGGRGKVQNLKTCPISPNWFSEALLKVREWWLATEIPAFNARRGEGSLRTVTFREGTNSKMAILTVSGDPAYALTKAQINSFVEALSTFQPISLFLRIHQAIKGQKTEFFMMHLKGPDSLVQELEVPEKVLFNISPDAFFQPNPDQAQVLYRTAISLLTVKPGAIVYDLYCGTGTLGIILAKKGYEVYGIELNRAACLDAEENAKLNEVSKIKIYSGDVAQVLATKNIPKPEAIVVDPPRTGLSPEAIEQITGLKPKEILYISCNPETQARDVALLKEKGYEIQTVQPVDQFPHTPHIENIVLLSSINPSII